MAKLRRYILANTDSGSLHALFTALTADDPADQQPDTDQPGQNGSRGVSGPSPAREEELR